MGAWVVSGLLWPVTALCFGSSNKIPCLRGTGLGSVLWMFGFSVGILLAGTKACHVHVPSGRGDAEWSKAR